MEEFVKSIALYAGLAIEAFSAVIIAVAVLKAIWFYSLKYIQPSSMISNSKIRIQLGTSIVLSLELLLGADILQTAVAPSWDDIGQLASIAAIRTTLNYFLEKELKEIREESKQLQP